MFEFHVRRLLISWSKLPALMKLLERKTKLKKVTELTGSLSGNTLENIVDEGVEDSHCLVQDTGIRVDLLRDLEG